MPKKTPMVTVATSPIKMRKRRVPTVCPSGVIRLHGVEVDGDASNIGPGSSRWFPVSEGVPDISASA
jgi:hypothetical protein